MKFGKWIRQEARGNKGLYYVNFKQLKRKIKELDDQLKRRGASPSSSSSFSSSSSSFHPSASFIIDESFKFAECLDRELRRVNDTFHRDLHRIEELEKQIHLDFSALRISADPSRFRHMSFEQLLAYLQNGGDDEKEKEEEREKELEEKEERRESGGDESEELRRFCVQLGKISARCKRLRRYVVWNCIAVVKILKKRRKHVDAFGPSPSFLSASNILAKQRWYCSPKLPEVLSSVDTLSEELIQKLTLQPPSAERYACPICLDLIFDPVALRGCCHRFCWNCLAQAALTAQESNQELERCPYCRTAFTLDPDAFEVDGILNRFLRTYFPEDIKTREVGGALRQGSESEVEHRKTFLLSSFASKRGGGKVSDASHCSCVSPPPSPHLVSTSLSPSSPLYICSEYGEGGSEGEKRRWLKEFQEVVLEESTAEKVEFRCGRVFCDPPSFSSSYQEEMTKVKCKEGEEKLSVMGNDEEEMESMENLDMSSISSSILLSSFGVSSSSGNSLFSSSLPSDISATSAAFSSSSYLSFPHLTSEKGAEFFLEFSGDEESYRADVGEEVKRKGKGKNWEIDETREEKREEKRKEEVVLGEEARMMAFGSLKTPQLKFLEPKAQSGGEKEEMNLKGRQLLKKIGRKGEEENLIAPPSVVSQVVDFTLQSAMNSPRSSVEEDEGFWRKTDELLLDELLTNVLKRREEEEEEEEEEDVTEEEEVENCRVIVVEDERVKKVDEKKCLDEDIFCEDSHYNNEEEVEYSNEMFIINSLDKFVAFGDVACLSISYNSSPSVTTTTTTSVDMSPMVLSKPCSLGSIMTTQQQFSSSAVSVSTASLPPPHCRFSSCHSHSLFSCDSFHSPVQSVGSPDISAVSSPPCPFSVVGGYLSFSSANPFGWEESDEDEKKETLENDNTFVDHNGWCSSLAEQKKMEEGRGMSEREEETSEERNDDEEGEFSMKDNNIFCTTGDEDGGEEEDYRKTKQPLSCCSNSSSFRRKSGRSDDTSTCTWSPLKSSSSSSSSDKSDKRKVGSKEDEEESLRRLSLVPLLQQLIIGT